MNSQRASLDIPFTLVLTHHCAQSVSLDQSMQWLARQPGRDFAVISFSKMQKGSTLTHKDKGAVAAWVTLPLIACVGTDQALQKAHYPRIVWSNRI